MIVVLIYLLLIASFIVSRIKHHDAVHWSAWPGYLTLGFVSILLICTFITYPFRLLLEWGLPFFGIIINQEHQLFLAQAASGTAAIIAIVLAIIGVVTAISKPSISEIEVPIDRLSHKLDGYTIIQISDVHLGRTIGRSYAERIVQIANSLKGDLITITGDLVDGRVNQLQDVVAPFANLKARDGVWSVTGNHEYYVEADLWVKELHRLGIQVLHNERVSIGEGKNSFDLVGVDDLEANLAGHGHDLSRALLGRDQSRPIVLLAHQPKVVVEAAQLGVDLQLSGHTHGGQIWPLAWLVRLQQRYVAGLYIHEKTHLYVNRGAGYWGPPMRVGSKPEIARLTLRSVKS
ncbi:metallophosphoesterase [Spartinivicinus ruber]|uniref:metallophosphoesterase n=1 Tax=Spartinivicinus ruber TaxID=2683272 RepID=UPI0013D50573|nr:metallophosphoesterase [Spartinivicinus ruber]